MSMLDWWAVLGAPACLMIGATIGILTRGADAYDHGYEAGRDDERAEQLAEPGRRDDLMAVADAIAEPASPAAAFRPFPPVEAHSGWSCPAGCDSPCSVPPDPGCALYVPPEPAQLPSAAGRTAMLAELAPEALAASSTGPPDPDGTRMASLSRAGELAERRTSTAEHGAILDYTRMTWPEQQFVQVWGWARRVDAEIEGYAARVLAQPLPWEIAA
jgi:hypothetical protein